MTTTDTTLFGHIMVATRIAAPFRVTQQLTAEQIHVTIEWPMPPETLGLARKGGEAS